VLGQRQPWWSASGSALVALGATDAVPLIVGELSVQPR
jgi:hypothetical protein